MIIDDLEKLLASDASFASRLRFLDGYDEDSLEELITTLYQVAKEFKGDEYVPKKLANMLIDLVPSLVSSSYSYGDSERKRIDQAIDKISEAIRSIFAK